MGMMKGRNLVNLIGIPGWLFLIWLGGVYYSIFILVVMGLAIGEYYNLADIKGGKPLRWMGFCSTVFIADYFYNQPELTAYQLLGCIIIVVILTLVWELFTGSENSSINIAYTLSGILFIPVLLGPAIFIRQFDENMGSQLTLAMVVSVWVCDSAAYIFGSKFGTKKIFPRVSPGKSWVGSVSGAFAAIALFYAFHQQEWLGNVFDLKDAIVFGIITGVFGQLGDFTESLLKRDANVKDSGGLLLGHGGVLDRFDSLIFATPLTYLYLQFII
ncbi:MAG: phosphatidate cytidylyltransferase [Candidatus Neomarinimicrobiota bacterium]|nr:phosphatidate cytidylyltransferase [Candidatus Neomarinimicrobiota bacterium]